MSLYDLWSSGAPLGAAAVATADGQRWVRDEARLKAAYDRLRTDPRSPCFDRAATLTSLQDLGSESEALAASLDELHSALRQRLAVGAVIAVGFERDAEGGCDRLTAVPPGLWRTATVDWQESSLNCGRRRIRDIRVAAATTVLTGPDPKDTVHLP